MQELPDGHFTPVQIPGRSESIAHWAIRPAGSAIIFVHGYRGHATKTWSHFPLHLLRNHQLDNTDLIFFSYNWRNQTAVGASDLYQFLRSLVHDRRSAMSDLAADMIVTPENFAYRRLIVAAHSLGSIIARRMLVIAAEQQQDWVSKMNLILYSPVHMGADTASLVAELLTGTPMPAKVVGQLTAMRRRCIKEMSVNSPTLLKLLADSVQLINTQGAEYLVARSVVIGADDYIVNHESFAADPPPYVIQHCGHIEVCKPEYGRMEPYTYLEQVL